MDGLEKCQVLDQRQQTVFLKITSASDDIYSKILRLQLFTGLRIGELLALSWSNIDLDKQQIMVKYSLGYHQTRSGWKLSKQATKNRKHRVVPMLPQAAELLGSIKHRRGYVFKNKNGPPPSNKSINNALIKITKKMAEALGENDLNFTSHTLRHTFATRAQELGIPMKQISLWLGHSSTAITDKIYAHVLPQQTESSVALLHNAFLSS